MSHSRRPWVLRSVSVENGPRLVRDEKWASEGATHWGVTLAIDKDHWARYVIPCSWRGSPAVPIARTEKQHTGMYSAHVGFLFKCSLWIWVWWMKTLWLNVKKKKLLCFRPPETTVNHFLCRRGVEWLFNSNALSILSRSRSCNIKGHLKNMPPCLNRTKVKTFLWLFCLFPAVSLWFFSSSEQNFSPATNTSFPGFLSSPISAPTNWSLLLNVNDCAGLLHAIRPNSTFSACLGLNTHKSAGSLHI